MNPILLFCLLTFLPQGLHSQVPTICDPVPVQGLAFYYEVSEAYRSPANNPLVVRATVDSSGHCKNPEPVRAGQAGTDSLLFAKLDQLKFLPGRWGAEAVPRKVLLVFSREKGEFPKTDGASPDFIPAGTAVYHFYPSMPGWEKEKEEYFYYQHIHRYLYPPVGYEESDEDGNFTESIVHNRFPNADEFPQFDVFITGWPPELLNLETFREKVSIPRVLEEINFDGTVILRILVDKEGLPTRYIVLKDGGHKLFLEAFTACIPVLRFTPGKNSDQEPVYGWVSVPFRFHPK